MAELTSGLTSVVFSPYSKMFIGGLSWQTSPGENLILFYGAFAVVLRPGLSARCGCWRRMCECAPCRSVLYGISHQCVRTMLFLISVHSEVLYSTPTRIAGCYFSPALRNTVTNSVATCFCQITRHILLCSQTALETILVNSEK